MLMRLQYDAGDDDTLWVTMLRLYPQPGEEPYNPHFGPLYFDKSIDFLRLALKADLRKETFETIWRGVKTAKTTEWQSWTSEAIYLTFEQLDKLGFKKFRVIVMGGLGNASSAQDDQSKSISF
jgi:hypothetical protein